MPTNCNFVLNSPNAVYYSGQVVSGTITLSTTKDKDINSIRIVFVGEGKVKWTESESSSNSDGTSSSSSTNYTSHKVYINNETPVRGLGILPMGQHTYKFTISLPWECPNSFEGKWGHIRYVISLLLDMPFRFNKTFQKPLTVLQTVDLNSNPVFKIPVVAEEIGNLSCCACSDGKLFYTLTTPFGAYVPGQTVDYTLRIQNQTMTDTVGYSLVFTQKQIFIANSPRPRQRSKKITLVQQGFNETCSRLSTRVFQGQFKIPSVGPSTTNPDAIIKLEYKLKVTVHLSGCNSNTCLKIPILIGTIPIMTRRPVIQEVRTPEAIATAPDLEEKDADLPPSYKELYHET